MESSELRDLLDFLAKSHFVEFEMEREGFRLRVRKPEAGAPAAASNGTPVAQPAAPIVIGAPAATPAPEPTAAIATEADLVTVTSPMVGTFYRSPSPEAPPFVEVGTRVRKGQPLCIVEAMKLMNEIESELEGEIVDVLVANGQPIEYGEELFRIRPLG